MIESLSFDGKAISWIPPAIAFSPDSQTLAAGKEDLTIQLLDVATGTESRCLGVPEPRKDKLPNPQKYIADLEFSPDGKILACCGRLQDIVLREVTTGKEIRRLSGGLSGATRLAFSPDGKMLASGSSNFFGLGLVRLWDMTTFQQLSVLNHRHRAPPARKKTFPVHN